MKYIIPRNKGLIIVAVMIILSVALFYGVKLDPSGRSQFAVLGVYVLGIAWTLIDFKRTSATDKSFKEYFATGFKAFIVITLLMVIYTFIFYKLNLQIREEGIAINNKLLLEEGNHTPAEIEKNAEQLRSIFIPMMVGINMFKYLITGALVTVIGAGFLSQKRSN